MKEDPIDILPILVEITEQMKKKRFVLILRVTLNCNPDMFEGCLVFALSINSSGLRSISVILYAVHYIVCNTFNIVNLPSLTFK